MSSYTVRSLLVVFAVLVLAPASARAGAKSHVGVPPGQMLNLRGGALNNGSAFTLKLDLAGPAFEVPAGYVFVATDVQIYPSSGVLDGSQQFLVYVNFDNAGQRYLFADFLGSTGYTASFTSGFVSPAGTTPTIVNLGGSDGSVIVGVQGYLLKATALPANTPF